MGKQYLAVVCSSDFILTRLRTEAEPYTGLVDCAKTIINEEGFRALYRAWWVTLLGGLVSALA